MEQQTLTLSELSDSARVRELLEPRLGEAGARPVSGRVVRSAERLLASRPGTSHAVVVYAPGRIELVGKHTDYAGGESLTCAVRRAFCSVAAPTQSHGIDIVDLGSGQERFIHWSSDDLDDDLRWTTYPRTVVRRVVNNFGSPKGGIVMAFTNDIPRASGMSSSSAFVVSVWLAIEALTGISRTRSYRANLLSGFDLSAYLGCVENGSAFRALSGRQGVGTRGGSQDHTAILFSSEGRIGHYAYRPLERKGTYLLPRELEFTVASSGVRAQKSGNAKRRYNEAAFLATRITSLWNRATGENAESLGDVLRSDSFSEELLMRTVDSIQDDHTAARLKARYRQFEQEMHSVIPRVVASFTTCLTAARNAAGEEHGKPDSATHMTLGDAVRDSQEMAEKLLGNQVPETVFLAQSAGRHGALAASSFGAGYGGSVWALIEKERATEFIEYWRESYLKAFPDRAENAIFFRDPTGPGAFVLGDATFERLIESKS